MFEHFEHFDIFPLVKKEAYPTFMNCDNGSRAKKLTFSSEEKLKSEFVFTTTNLREGEC